MKLLSTTLFLLVLLLCVTAAAAQTEELEVIALRDSVIKAKTRQQLQTMASRNLETALLSSSDDVSALLTALNKFSVYVNGRLKKTEPARVYKQDLLTELQTATALDVNSLNIFDRAIAVIPASGRSEDINQFIATYDRSRKSVAASMAGFYALSSTLRQTRTTLARSDAILKKLPYDNAKDIPSHKAALFDMNRAIELTPEKKDYYESRARIHTKLGDAAAAQADMAKAASLPGPPVK
jgi:hypothetical protein